MMRKLYDRYFTSIPYTIIVAGLDGAGKTTILNILRKSDITTLKPAIGFFIEETNTSDIGRSTKLIALDTGIGCAPNFAKALVRSYLELADAVIWVVDSADRDRLFESTEELQYTVQVNKINWKNGINGTPFLLLATKQDLPHAMPVEKIKTSFHDILIDLNAAEFGVSLLEGMQDSQFVEAVDWLRKSATNNATNNAVVTPPSSDTLVLSNDLRTRVESWILRTRTDSSPEEFLKQFRTFTLPSWDHYTHIRLAYVILNLHGRQKGKDILFLGLETYILGGPAPNKFHVTMTYFWLQLVHYAVQSMGWKLTPELGKNNMFAKFILMNPYLADGGLWKEYYSTDIMMQDSARTGMIFPDKKAMPSVLAK